MAEEHSVMTGAHGAAGRPAADRPARVAVWAAADLAPADRRARRRGEAPEPLLVEDVAPDVPLVIGRRRSSRHAPRGMDDGMVRLALDQREQPDTSGRHVEIRGDGGWSVRVRPEVKSPARLRSWGELTWTVGAAGLRWPLHGHRPVAVLLPGTPGYVVSVVAPCEAPAGGSSGVALGVGRDGVEGGPAVVLAPSELVTLVRSFRTCLQWPPRSEDDDDPGWTGAGIRHPEALRMAYRRLYLRLREPLGLPVRLVRGTDLTLVERLVETGALTLDAVQDLAAGCDLDLLTAAARPPSRPPSRRPPPGS